MLLLLLLLADLELGQLMPWPDVRRSSVVHRLSLAFHIFDISRAKTWTELKLSGVGWGGGGGGGGGQAL